MTDPNDICDLRSDTVTRPSPAMREVMASAPVGDDQYGEDLTMNQLQDKVAELLGKEAALWMPSGTMVNQVALQLLTEPGDDVIVSQESHAVWHEAGASAKNAGVQFTPIGSKGVFSADEFRAVIKPRGHMIYPPTTLVEIENTHNRAGGVIVPQDEIVRVCDVARENGIASYLDGARLWNVAVATGMTPAELAEPFDLVGVALSKGLGAPGGSLLAGRRELIQQAVRYRRIFGGAMRQVGFYGAAGIYALDHHFDQLAEDHAKARMMAERLAQSSHVVLDPETVQTNILVFGVTEDAPDAATVVERARERGVLMFPFGHRIVRATTHRDISYEQCERAAEIVFEIVES